MLNFQKKKRKLVFADKSEVEIAKHSKDVKADLYELSNFMIENVKGKTLKRDLFQLLTDKFDCTSRTIETRLKSIQDGANDLKKLVMNWQQRKTKAEMLTLNLKRPLSSIKKAFLTKIKNVRNMKILYIGFSYFKHL